MRLTAHFQAFQRPGAMVFTVQLDHTPAFADLVAIEEAFDTWMGPGGIVGFGYLGVCSDSCHYVGCRVESIDDVGEAFLYTVVTDRIGFEPGLAFDMLPTSCAPLVFWTTDPHRARRGRTYLYGVGLQAVDFEGDKMTVNALYRASLAALMMDLHAAFVAIGALGLVLLEYQRRGVRYPVAPSFPVVGAYLLDAPMGTQRRRSYDRKRSDALQFG